MMKYLQKLGKSLMLPVACLPVCGILMGIGYALCPSTMQGGDISGAAQIIGFFLVKAGGALIDNMSWLFAIGVAVGMADDNDGTAGLAGLVSWLMITNLLATGTVATLTGVGADAVNPAFAKIGNQFIGILAGLIGSTWLQQIQRNQTSGCTFILLRKTLRSNRNCSCFYRSIRNPVLRMADRLYRTGNSW